MIEVRNYDRNLGYTATFWITVDPDVTIKIDSCRENIYGIIYVPYFSDASNGYKLTAGPDLAKEILNHILTHGEENRMVVIFDGGYLSFTHDDNLWEYIIDWINTGKIHPISEAKVNEYCRATLSWNDGSIEDDPLMDNVKESVPNPFVDDIESIDTL